MLVFHMAPKTSYRSPVLWKSFRFQVLGAEQPLPVSTCSYFEVKVLHNPDTRGGLALGVCGHLPSGTETHSIRPLLWWEEEKGKNWRVVLVFVFAGGDICRLIIVLHTAYIYTYAGQAHLAIFIEQMLIETDCFHCISSNIYWADMFWHWARLFLRFVLWQTETSIWFQ